MTEKILVIINPKAGKNTKVGLQEELIEQLVLPNTEVEIQETKGPEDAVKLAKDAAENRYKAVIAVGGDGTVNEVARGLIGSNTALGIIPFGSGNGLARSLHIPITLTKAYETIKEFHVKKIDTVKIGSRYFIGVAGVGFDAQVSENFANCGKRGFPSYLKVVLEELPFYENKTYELIVDDKHITRTAFLICFANSAQFGNNATIAPNAKMDDGLIDLIVLKSFPMHAIPKLTFDLFNKKIHESKYFERILCKQVTLLSSFEKMHIDGDPISFSQRVTLSICPSSLIVITKK